MLESGQSLQRKERRCPGRGRRPERGFALIATGLSIVAVVAMTAAAIDFGRMYVAKNEVQSYADAAALAAVLEMDGTMAGLEEARKRARASINHWNFNTDDVTSVVVEFSRAKDGPWEESPGSAAEYLYARVTADVPVPLTFLQIVQSATSATVRAAAVAGQVLKTSIPEGLLPFSPFAHSLEAPHFGLIPGQDYTLRWATNPQLGKNTCAGDDIQEIIDVARAGGGEERGYIEENSASVIRQAIVYDYQTVERSIGDSVTMTGGAKQTQQDALIARVEQDSDPDAANYSQYEARAKGNGRRLVAVPINTGQPGGYTIVQFALFFLKPVDEYQRAQGGNKPLCAEYVGPYLQGSNSGGGSTTPGYYVARLVL